MNREEKDRLPRRDFLRSTCGLALSALASPRSLLAVGNPRRPNVLLIAVDDLNTRVRCYGDSVAQTPNLDRLAGMGVRFDEAVCQYPLCNPSRVSLLTGLRPDTTHVTDNRTSVRSALPDRITLPQLFRQQGYFTARVSKVFHDGLDDPLAWDVIHDTTASSFEVQDDEGTPGQKRPLLQAAEGTDEDQPDGQTVTETVRLLEEKRDRPYFLAVGLRKPHIPWVAPKQYFDLYDPSRIPLPTVPLGDRDDIPPAALTPRGTPPGFSDTQRREVVRAYYACVSFLDAQVGKLLDALERLRLLESTVVVLFSDHGFHLGEHELWGKRTLFEESARSPLFIAAPGVRGRQVCRRVVEFVDIYPTITDLCGVTNPVGLEGFSLRPLLKNARRSWNKAGFTQVARSEPSDKSGEGSPPPRTFMGRSIRTQRWRFTEWDDGKAGVELYDHLKDPREYVNLAQNPEYSAKVKELQKLLHAGWRGVSPTKG